ncbi:MAG: SPOR domain-containing protein [Methylibium sp.]|uniref:SPOR domain-containing protein n=1 Tax=Methylibium sp. TaxID=2067992 RepID=UPI001794F657|nr:SPOR domain-containing protein [Methylibium sp.]MBA3596231.1 SPOR domain-containing protein [Methylibium sp.]
MGLLSFLQRKAAIAAASDPLSIDAARLRARRRLIGAVVLVAVGVVGFPLLFDTSPRPVSPDIAMEIPEQQAVAASAVAKPAPDTAAAPAVSKEEVIVDRAADTDREIAASPVATPAPVAPDRVAEKPSAPPAEAEPARKPAPAAAPSKGNDEAARALAALQGKSTAPATPAAPREDVGRFVVQVGAFSEATSARRVRQRVEKLGLKTYTQVVETAAGKRIRVRIGPYGERGEADRAAAKLKQAGLQPAVLTL